MESLALFVAVMLLAVFSSAFVAAALSFIDSPVARGTVYVLSPIVVGFGVFLAISTRSTGSWIMALVLIALGGFSLWNSLRVKKYNKEIKRLTSE
jgi:hypothetical protein